jgi:hypothetical protein
MKSGVSTLVVKNISTRVPESNGFALLLIGITGVLLQRRLKYQR